MTPGEWDTREWLIFNDLLSEGVDGDQAHDTAARECAEQFGPRPQEATR